MYAKINGCKIFFDIEGSSHVAEGGSLREKPVLFLLHGGPGCDHSNFKPWLSPLSEHAQLVYIDHRGNGRSDDADKASYTIEQMADDVEALRKYLGFSSISVLGHSFGGMVAQVHAIRHPKNLQGLILSSTTASADFWEEAQEIADRIATAEQKEVLGDLFEGRIKSKEDFDSWWETCFPLYFYKPDPKILKETLSRMRGRFEVANFMMAHEISKFDIRRFLPDVRTPTLVLSGRHDWVTPVSQSQTIFKALPNAKIFTLEKSGHMTFCEEQEIYLQYVREFLEQLTVTTAV
jgi:proline iminopeptidase